MKRTTSNGLIKVDFRPQSYSPVIKRASDMRIVRRFESGWTFDAAVRVAEHMAAEFQSEMFVVDEDGGSTFVRAAA